MLCLEKGIIPNFDPFDGAEIQSESLQSVQLCDKSKAKANAFPFEPASVKYQAGHLFEIE